MARTRTRAPPAEDGVTLGAPDGRARKFAALLIVAALASTFALFFAAVVMAIAVAVRYSLGAAGPVHPVVRLLVPIGLVAIGVFAGVDLVLESARILD